MIKKNMLALGVLLLGMVGPAAAQETCDFYQARPGSALSRAGWRNNPAYSGMAPVPVCTASRGEMSGAWSSPMPPAAIKAPYTDGRGILAQAESVTILVQCGEK